MSLMGTCFCGAVGIEISGAPEAMGYCHCSSCRSWSGGPVNAFSLWKPEAVRIASGAEHVATFQKTALSQRRTAKNAAGTSDRYPPIGWSTYSPPRPHPLRAGRSRRYAETVLPMRDILPAEGFPRRTRRLG